MLTAFFDEMRRELALTEPDFALWLSTLASAPPDASEFTDAFDAYSAQLLRIGQTAEMLGMPGLGTWSMHANAALAGLAALAPSALDMRVQSTQYFARWPKLVDSYFASPADFDASMALAEYLSETDSPLPIDEAASLSLIELLTTPPVIPEDLLAEMAQAEAPAVVSVDDTSLHINDEADPDVYQAFIDEAPLNVEQFSKLTAKIAQGSAVLDDFRNAKRIAHSFKGSANIVGIRGIASMGHHTEDILEHFEKSETLPPPSLSRALVDASDCLAQMVGFLRGEEGAPDNSFQVLSTVVAWANKIKAGTIDEQDAVVEMVPESIDAASTATGIAATSTTSTSTEAEASLRVSVKTIDELFRLVSELATKIGQMESRVKLTNKRAKGMLTQNLAMQQRVLELEKLVVLRGLSIHSATAVGDSDFDPLEMDRYNELHGATRALVEVSADAREIASLVENDIATLQSDVLQQLIVNKDLQYQITTTRMTPVSILSNRLTRNVRQTSQQTRKEAELIIVGGEIQVDGDVLNKLADPLLHILRNAVDHGIETPAERAANNKPQCGVIKLSFTRQGSTIVVTIADDGRGFDYARIREKAIERGLIDANQTFTEQALARITLLPGFSTRDAVSEVSGRGVGMDVVATRLAELKGNVDLSSVSGKGSLVTLRFQASLVTQHALLAEAADQIFAIPSHNIEQITAAGIGEIDSNSDGALVYRYRDVSYPLRELGTLTGYPVSAVTPDDFARLPKALIMTDGQTYAVAVTRVVDSRELIVKSMGHYLQRVHGVSGAALMGDGTVVPVLNIKDLVIDPLAMTEAVAKMAAEARRQATRIVVVDDSVSVRKSLIQLFEDAGYDVRAASDGLDAIRVIAEFHPHAVCTDMEMPNMNGLELTQHLRQKQETTSLPIMMITSRSMDKHREQAARVGVDVYVTKPYVDMLLIRQMRELIASVAVSQSSLVSN